MRNPMTSVRNLIARRELGLAIALVVLVAAVSSRFPAFATPATLGDIFNDSSILIILALGQMAVLVTRGVDLSVASIVALAGMAASAAVSRTNGRMPAARCMTGRPIRRSSVRRASDLSSPYASRGRTMSSSTSRRPGCGR